MILLTVGSAAGLRVFGHQLASVAKEGTSVVRGANEDVTQREARLTNDDQTSKVRRPSP